jgi:hypothetical protein
MHVRIDQSRDQKSSAAVYPPGMRTENKVFADFSDPAIAENNISMKQRSIAFRRDQSDIFDYHALINNALPVYRGPNIQNDERGQCPRYQSIAQDHPLRLSPNIGPDSARPIHPDIVATSGVYELCELKVPPVASYAIQNRSHAPTPRLRQKY